MSHDFANVLVFLATLDDTRYAYWLNYRTIRSSAPAQDMTLRGLAEAATKIMGYQDKFVQDTSKPEGTKRKIMYVPNLQSGM